MTTATAAPPSTTKAIKQAAAAGTASPVDGTCKDCVKTGLAVLPVLYAVVPKAAVTALPKLETPFGKGVIDKSLNEAGYYLRAPSAGYIYVLYPTGEWDGYVVGRDGLLFWEPTGSMTSDPGSKSMSEACARENHNIPAQVLAIRNPSQHKNVWLAFSRERWSLSVLQRYAANTDGCRDARMQTLDMAAALKGAAMDHGVVAATENIEKWVANYRPETIVRKITAEAVIALPERHGQAAALAERMLQIGKAQNSQGVIFAMTDIVGVLEQLNRERQFALAKKLAWQAEPTRAWKRLSSDAIVVLRNRITARKKAEIIQENTGKPWSEANAPKEITMRHVVLEEDFLERKHQGGLPKEAQWKQQPDLPPGFGRVTVSTDDLAKIKADPETSRLEKHYKEKERAGFVTEYDAEIKKLTQRIDATDKDYSVWLNAIPVAGSPDLTTLCRWDFEAGNPDGSAGYIRSVSVSVTGGAMSLHSAPWFQKTLKLGLGDPGQVLLRALAGNNPTLFKFLTKPTEKQDKTYDAIKGVLTADDIKASKWLTPALAAFANPILACVGATAFILNKDGGIDRALRDRAIQAVRFTLALWPDFNGARTHITTLKMHMSIGDLQQAALKAGFKSFAEAAKRGSKRLPARLRLPKALAEKTIDAVFWTTDKVEDLIAKLPRVTDPAKQAEAIVEGINKATQSTVKKARYALAPGASRDIAADILKRTDTMMGGPGLLATGVLILQAGQFLQNLEAATKVGGADQFGALMGLGDALAGLLGASTELVGELHKAAAMANKLKYDKVWLKGVGRVAAGFGAVASAFNAVQCAGLALQRGTEGDNDSAWLYGFAGTAFVGATVFGAAIFFGAKNVFLGSMLGLGPAGWLVLLSVAAVGLWYLAKRAEDNDAEVFVARNSFWSQSKRTDTRFRKWQEEAEAFTALWYGVKANLNWGDTIGGTLGYGLDKLEIVIKLAEHDAAEGWRYRLLVVFPSGNEVEIYNRAENVPRFVPEPKPGDPPPEQPSFRAVDPKAKYFMEGRDFRWHREPEIGVDKDDGIYTIRHLYELNDMHFRVARLVFEYWPDAANLDDKTTIEVIEMD